MKLSGEMRIRKDGKTIPLKLEAVAHHEYPERLLVVAADGGVQKTERLYETAKATITIGTDRVKHILPPSTASSWPSTTRTRDSSTRPPALTREELDLTAGQFDSSAVTGILAGRDVAVGDTWKLPAGVVQALCNFEGLTEHTVTGKLDAVTAETATFSLTGTATGIDLGAIAKVKIDAVGQFNVKAKRLVSLEWRQKEQPRSGAGQPCHGGGIDDNLEAAGDRAAGRPHGCGVGVGAGR